VGKAFRRRLGISALAGLFHGAKRQVYSALAEKFAPLRKWICAAATCVAAEVQRDYLNFRLDHGLVTYDDQIALAEELLQHPVAAQRIREESFRVILDEAQDTEPLQFSVLLEVTRPPEAKGLWLQDRHLGPAAGALLHGRRFPAIDLLAARRT
jgi:ATP-dependent exoDNAse (exonuclease V) beta subunit